MNNGALSEGIFLWIPVTCSAVVVYLLSLHTDILEHLVKCPAEMSECNCAVMRVILFYKHMTIKTSHLVNCKYTYSSERTGLHRQNFALCDIRTKLCVGGALKSEECDVARSNISLKRALRYLLGKRACHYLLILHLAGRKLTGRGVSAVEAHKCIVMSVAVFPLYAVVEHILGNAVVDVKESYCVT